MKKRILFSGIITLILLMVFVFTGPVYSFAGDGSIAKYLASNAEPGFNSISWGIGAFLKVFVRLFPSVNWWTMFSIFMMFSSQFFLTLFIQELFDGIKGYLLAVVFSLFLWEAAYSIDINFTQTAILSGITGTSASLLITIKKTMKGKICYALIGAIYILVAGSLRFDAMIMCIPFAVVVLAIRCFIILANNRNSKKEQNRNNIKTETGKQIWGHAIVPLAVMICSVLVSLCSHLIYRHIDSDIAFFEDTFDLTREVYDYIDMYPEYDEVRDVYEAAGLKSSWYAMLTNYFIADTNYFNIETMSVPLQFKGPSNLTFGGYMEDILGHKGALILGLLVVILAGVITELRKVIIPLSSAIVVFLVSGMYFVHVGRYAWRVSGGVTVACVVMGLMMLAALLSEYDSEDICKTCKVRSVIGYAVTAISFIAVGIHIIISKNFSIPRPEVTDTAKAGLLDYMDSNKDIIYFTEDFDYASHNIWYIGQPGYLDNKYTIFAGYNEGRKSDLQAAGINDMSSFVINMLTRDDIYTEYSEIWLAYLCDYYNPYVSAGIVDVYEETGTQFIRYVAPVEATADSYDDTVSDVSLYVDSSKQADNYQVVHISAKTAVTDEDIEYYMNIENASTGAIYSYPLLKDDDRLVGDAIWINDTWSFMDTRQYIVAKFPDGTIVRVLDISGTPVPFV